VKFVSYNLERGGTDRDGSEARWRDALDMLPSLDADAYCLQECRGWRTDGRLDKLTAATGTVAYVAPHPSGLVPAFPDGQPYPVGYDLTIIVREGIRVGEFRPNPPHLTYPAGVHAAALTLLLDGWVEPLWIVNVHLCPWDGDIRHHQAAAVASYMQHPYALVCGDWNFIGLADPEPDYRQLPAHLRLDNALPGCAPGNPISDRRGAQRLTDAGLTDVGAQLGAADTPTSGHWPNAFMPLRKDMFWVTPGLANSIVSYRVHSGEPWPRLSDHFPVEFTTTGRPDRRLA
jgi:hypothetical protein